VAGALEESQYPADRLAFEITETVFTGSLEPALEQIEALCLLGVHFSIDDFGACYSSYNVLSKLPVDTVKIGRSYIRTIDSADVGGSTLVSGIIALAHHLSLKVVAEGVETEKQLAILQGMGCDLSQGFLLHRPMPPAEAAKTLGDAVPQGLRLLGRAASKSDAHPEPDPAKLQV
jgi:EAL domain-containing protein (putative c-di-GMP-specific phosphodiesterase class I)